MESLIAAFGYFIATLPNFYFWNRRWALRYACIQLRDFPESPLFHQILSLVGNLYIQYLMIII